MSGRKIASIFDQSKDEGNQGRQDEDGQAFYAGGSEHSGQQILGPGRDARFFENLLNDARRHAEQVTSESLGPNEPVAVTLWRNGFTIGDDGELRDYANNREFIECLRRGEVPAELASRVRGGMTDIKLSTKESQDYEPPKSRFQVFTGEGRRLGVPAPELVDEQQRQQQQGPSRDQPSIDEIRQARLARFTQRPKDDK